MTSVISIHKKVGKDVWAFKNQVEWLGFPKERTFGQMVDLAIQHNCNIITKNGGGKWYLKNEDYSETMARLNDPTTKYDRKNYQCWVLTFETETDV